MRRFASLVALSALTALLLSPAPARAGELDAAWAARATVADAIVLIEYVLERPGRGFGDAGQRVELATVGTIVRPDGLVLLSDNLFPGDAEESRSPARPRDFRARLHDGRRLKASLVGRDRTRSIAALQLEAEPDEVFPSIEFAPAAPLAPGARVLLASLLPERYDYEPTFTEATVAVRLPGERELWDLDAFIPESTLGTPVLDAEGRVAGFVATDPFGNASAGSLAAPLKLVGAVTRLKEPGFPVLVPATDLVALVNEPPTTDLTEARGRAWLGVTLQPVDRNLAEVLGLRGPSGILVTSVWGGSPAAEAGVRPEDVIVRFDGEPITVTTEEALGPFIEGVQRAEIGRALDLVIVRDGRRRELTVTLAAAPTTAMRADEYRNVDFGLVAQDLTLDVIMGRGWPPETRGGLISEVETAGWAQVSGLQPGDLVLGVGDRPVTGVADLRAALEAAAEARTAEVVFFVQRDPDTLFVPVRTSW